MTALKEDFYKQLGDSREIKDIIDAYGAVNSLSLARSVIEGETFNDEYVEIYDDYVENLRSIDGLEDALKEEWEGDLPRVLRIGKTLKEQESDEFYLSMFDGLTTSKRRQVTMILDYAEGLEGFRKDFDFSFHDGSADKNLMVTDDMSSEDIENEYNALKAALIHLIRSGGGAAFHWYIGTEKDYLKKTCGFAAKPGQIARVQGWKVKEAIGDSRAIEGNEKFVLAGVNLRILG